MRTHLKPNQTESNVSNLTRRFPTGPVKRLIEETLSKHLSKVQYDQESSPELCKTISNDLLSQIKGNFYDFILRDEL